jgi:hypothetical protein
MLDALIAGDDRPTRYPPAMEPSKGGRSGLGLLGFTVLAIVIITVVAASVGHQVALAERALENLAR